MRTPVNLLVVISLFPLLLVHVLPSVVAMCNNIPIANNDAIYVDGNHIYICDGKNTIWKARGANVNDHRLCGECVDPIQGTETTKQYIDALVNTWGANFIRIPMQTYSNDDSSRTKLNKYLNELWEIIEYITSNFPHIQLLLSLWIDPIGIADYNGGPTQYNGDTWYTIASTLLNMSLTSNTIPTRCLGNVWFGISNEPGHASSTDEQNQAIVYGYMQQSISKIRQAENEFMQKVYKIDPQSYGCESNHIIAVQGLLGYGRDLSYYMDHKFNDASIVYETHPYNLIPDFNRLVITPAQHLPVIIGEFGPVLVNDDQVHTASISSTGDWQMDYPSANELTVVAESAQIPYLAWIFSSNCEPSILSPVDDKCQVGSFMPSTDWGYQFWRRMHTPYGTSTMIPYSLTDPLPILNPINSTPPATTTSSSSSSLPLSSSSSSSSSLSSALSTGTSVGVYVSSTSAATISSTSVHETSISANITISNAPSATMNSIRYILTLIIIRIVIDLLL